MGNANSVGSHNRAVITVLHMLSDYLAVTLAEKLALMIHAVVKVEADKVMTLPAEYQYGYVPLMFILVMLGNGCYRFNRPSMELVKDVFKGCIYSLMLCTLSLFLIRNHINISRFYTGSFFLMAMTFIAVFRCVLLHWLHGVDSLKEKVILIGAGKTAERVVNNFRQDNSYFYKMVGIIDDNPVSKTLPQKYPILGGFADAEKIIKENGVKTIIITAPGMTEESFRCLMERVQHLTDTVLFTPSIVGTPMGNLEISTLFVEQITVIKSKNNLSRWYNRMLKMVFDLVVTLIGTILISPILLILAIMVGISNGGGVIFAHKRIGRNGKVFPCYKFQTMVNNADEALEKYLKENPEARKEWEENFKLENDPRVTKLGAFLRKTSLDELPQVFNVLKGEMSLVGPRPIVQAEVEKYGENIREYYMVRPGITGMWQASGRSDTTYEERVFMDTWYVKNWSIWLDIKYLVRTFTVVIKREGAY